MSVNDSIIKILGGATKPVAGSTDSVIKALTGPTELLSDEKNPPPLNRSWGFHLLVDCSHMNERIDSEPDVKEFFDKLIKKMKMKKLTDFFYVKVDDPEDGRGMSAFQMITTSHISMHFDDAERSGYLDIFSCKTFDPKVVVEMIEEYFEPTHIATQFIYRDAGLLEKPRKKNEPKQPQ